MGKFGLTVKLVLAAAVAGLLVGGLLVPAFGSVGLLAKHTADDLSPLPLDAPQLPENSKIYATDGTAIASYYTENRTPVALNQIATVMQKALIDIEDERFYQHGPIDLKGTLRALVQDQSGSSVQGGSTLTQQYVKNVLFETAGIHKTAAQTAINLATAQLKSVTTKADKAKYQAALKKAQGDLADATEEAQTATKQTVSRKVKEMRYALWVEQHYSKDQILDDYMNTVFFGNNTYGVQAAAKRYFSVPASALTIPQAAMLAAMVNNANQYNPIGTSYNVQQTLARRNVVLQRMADLHTITQEQADQFKKTKLGIYQTQPQSGCVDIKAGYGFFCDYVIDEILTNPVFGATTAARQEFLDTGGLAIHTTLNPKAQSAAQHAVSNMDGSTSNMVTMEAMIQPGSGKIQAIALSRPYGYKHHQTTQDYAADIAHGGGAGNQAGSTFKIFTLAAALDNGFKLNKVYATPTAMSVSGYTNCAGQSVGTWDVHNAESSTGGGEDMATATWASTNVYFAQLERDVGLCKVAKVAANFGMTKTDGSPLDQFPSFTLGANDIDIVHEAAAYAGFAASGKYCSPIAISGMTDRNGKELAIPSANCHQAISADVANEVNKVLQGVLNHPGGTAYGVGIGRPAAGKTGTTDNEHQAVFAGYTPNMAAVLWRSDPAAPNNVYTGFGASLAGPWASSMEGALAGVSVKDFAEPSGDFGIGGLTYGQKKKATGKKSGGKKGGKTGPVKPPVRRSGQ